MRIAVFRKGVWDKDCLSEAGAYYFTCIVFFLSARKPFYSGTDICFHVMEYIIGLVVYFFLFFVVKCNIPPLDV